MRIAEAARAPRRFSLVSIAASPTPAFAEAVREGLARPPRSIPCRFLYDAAGSALFERICELPAYYPTRSEREILAARADAVAASCAPDTEVVELGSGSGAKTRLVLEALLRRQGRTRYLPVDISLAALAGCAEELLGAYPLLDVAAIHADYEGGLRFLDARRAAPRLWLWLGSNVGNFSRREAVAFLGRVRGSMADGDRLLLGVDLRKDVATLEAAYDDPDGVTAAFNKNLLARMNRELGARIDPASFRHEARWDPGEGRVRMVLVSARAQRL